MISNQNQFDTNAYLGLQQSMLRFLSLWPSATEGLLFKLARSFLLIIRVLLMLIASVGQIVQIYYMPDLGKISNIMDIVTLTTSGSYKAMFVFVRQRDYQKLVNVMQTKFMEKPFFGESKPRKTMRYYLRHTELLSNMYVYSSLIAITLWGLTPLLNNFIDDEETINHCNPTSSTLNYTSCNTLYKDLKLPINLWLPYDISWFPMYQILFVVVFVPLIDSTLFYIMEDAFFFTMLYSACGQFDLLKESLENMSQHIVKNERQCNRNSGVNGSHDDFGSNDYTAIDKTQYNEVELHNILKQCIEHHTVLLKFLRDYEKLSQTMIIVDFLHAIISLSFALLEITVSQNIIEYTKMLLFLVICIWHQFLNNHFGELIIQKQMSIADAAYDLPWVERSPQFRTSMKIMIMRAQQPVILNGLKMYFLCYKTFMEFTKALISYFMVLRTLQEGK